MFFNDYDRRDVPWKDVICHLSNVKSITYDLFCSDRILQRISKHCTKLETLSVGNSSCVTDKGLKYFSQMKMKNRRKRGERPLEEYKLSCPVLKKVFLKWTSVRSTGIEQLLRNLPSLVQIHHTDVPAVLHKINKDNLDSPENAIGRNLTYLDLSNCGGFAYKNIYDEIFRVCVTVCPNLKSFTCPIYNSTHLKLCSLLPNVVNLQLEFNCAEDIWAEISNFLKRCGRKLTSVTFRNCSISLLTLGQSCSNLRVLKLDEVSIKCGVCDYITTFNKLKAFTVEGVDISNNANCKAICSILRSPSLERLHFEVEQSFPPRLKNEFLKCCEQDTLKCIDFGWSPVELDFLVDIIQTCSSLESLNSDVFSDDYFTTSEEDW